jgi:N-acetylneuraminic acid mutarotase
MCVNGTPTAELYESASNSWEPAASMLIPRLSGESGSLLTDGRVLVAGGLSSSGIVAAAEIYDPASNSWSAAGNMVVPSNQHTATLMTDGTVLVVGGSGAAGFLAVSQIYDPVTNSWSQTCKHVDRTRTAHRYIVSEWNVVSCGRPKRRTSASEFRNLRPVGA